MFAIKASGGQQKGGKDAALLYRYVTVSNFHVFSPYGAVYLKFVDIIKSRK